ncbi:MAG: prolipoprotein diacylglyceryl transferase [Candidatus Kapabacteria bacterium]|nr:prolipoprotein diacylglyceryl transferase [Candidatus Kapabacteria bacterium]
MMNVLAYIDWSISPEIFSLGPIAPRWYGFLFAMGFVVGYFIMARIFKIEHKTQKDLDALSITMILSTVIGARLGHCLFYEPEIYLADPIKILYIWQGGLASHGAAVGIVFALWLYARKRVDIDTMWILDRIVIVIALAGFFIRMGNFFNSEILGLPADVPWAIIFSNIDNIPRHPVQLYEAFSYLAIFVFLYALYNKYKQNTPKGLLFGVFLTTIFGSRFFLEYFKTAQAAFETDDSFKMGQLLSIPLVLIGLYFIIRSQKK